ncbi:hypothetical protein BD414DRAFT_254950 [Trametes punicea]|nr:hypothetical protein BD414DRAFT_254950 [Trametes punicea]
MASNPDNSSSNSGAAGRATATPRTTPISSAATNATSAAAARGPSQLSNAARNLPPGAPNIRLGEFNPWVQNTGPNNLCDAECSGDGAPLWDVELGTAAAAAESCQQNLMANLGLNFGGMGQVPQQSQQGATGIMPGQGMGMGASMGMGMAWAWGPGWVWGRRGCIGGHRARFADRHASWREL